MGRAFRYVRRIAHIEIALAERGKNGAGDLATVVGEEKTAAAPVKKKRVVAKKKSAGKKAVAKK
jgi:large subunit ribosomal protein L22